MTRRRLAEGARRAPSEFQILCVFLELLVWCGSKTTLVFETVRVAWLEEVGLEEVALRRAGIQEAGWIDPEEACRGGERGLSTVVPELARAN